MKPNGPNILIALLGTLAVINFLGGDAIVTMVLGAIAVGIFWVERKKRLES